ncbi:MAG: DNA methyltransferase [Nitrospira sp.]|nr:DNA methyltransferase [Nitrospira sp.]
MSSTIKTVIKEPLGEYRNWDANKVQDNDSAAHRWYRFVLSFPPHLVRDYLDDFGVRNDGLVLDPFCGTGTTIVESKKLGISGIGLEALPMAHFASCVKTDWSPSPDALAEHAQRVADKTLYRLKADNLEDVPFFSDPSGSTNGLRTLPPEVAKILLRNSISPLPLHKVLVLLNVLEEEQDKQFLAHEKLALAKALVADISNLHFGPEVGVGKCKDDAPVVATWLSRVNAIVEDLRQLPRKNSATAQAFLADARQIPEILEPESVDAVITSPPYPNEKDYSRTTRLETVLLGFAHSMSDLRTLKKTLVRSNTRSVYKTDDDDTWVKGHKTIESIAREIEERRTMLGKTSGFERLYHRVTKLYFGGMARHLETMKRVLKPGAKLAYVVGDQASYLRVMIQTGQILAGLAKSQGYEPIRIDLFRTRLATATKEQLREEVLVLRWPGNRQSAGRKYGHGCT